MKFNKGQGALEYLLLIGGAVLIAVIVIALLVGMGSSSKSNAADAAAGATSATSSLAVAPVVYSDGCNLTTPAETLNITYNGGTLTADVTGLATPITAFNVTEPTTTGSHTITITGMCVGTGQKTVILTASNPSGTTARATYVFTDSTT